ncbi:PREDICTED: 39S ribosomal protein L38, mitochondrial-like [Branchiostoma belcheri]|uniref:Large ribosomal subunit protein mL38 n=1 Tax=Branchiostoma belcheri TaxID=7741 RepID=A0A6P5AF10_BRABE|nr:PREDICTED: 39S ribosomal protein L38, mitochondrial-like [Branchiostoma belcheri]
MAAPLWFGSRCAPVLGTFVSSSRHSQACLEQCGRRFFSRKQRPKAIVAPVGALKANVQYPEPIQEGEIKYQEEYPWHEKTSPISQQLYHSEEPPPSHGVDIGLPVPRFPGAKKFRQLKRKLTNENRASSELERAARLRTLKVPLDQVKEDWQASFGHEQLKDVATHYNIWKDLFEGAHFHPVVVTNVYYDCDDDHAIPVYRGNVVTPTEASRPPVVQYESDENSLWTLILTNPDGHLRDNEAEYLHWFVGNIPGSDISKGETVCEYFPPFPPQGTGYHRFVFILFKQEGPLDYSMERRPAPCHSLRRRTFHTFEFYRDRQDQLTPAGLNFFQCQWDQSVRDTFRSVLNMPEPIFEYDFPKPFIAPQLMIPHRKPIQYLDKYLPKEPVLKRF